MSINLAKLKEKQLRRANSDSCVRVKAPDDSPSDVLAARDSVNAALDSYFAQFVAPENGICVNCHRVLDGLLGSFQWGLVNGEGSCGQCGYPARALHDPKDEQGSIFERRLQLILQYHPDDLDPIPTPEDESDVAERLHEDANGLG